MIDAVQKVIDELQARGGMEDEIAYLESKADELDEGITEADVHMLLVRHMMSEVMDTGEDVQLDASEAEFMEQATASARETLEKAGYHYSEHAAREDYVIFEAAFRGENCTNVQLRVAVETNPRTCHVRAILPITVEDTYAYPFCKMITKLNYRFRYGCFNYNERDGEVSFECNFPIENDLDGDDLDTVINAVLSSADSHYSDIRRYAVGKFKKDEVKQILSEVKALVVDLKSFDA